MENDGHSMFYAPFNFLRKIILKKKSVNSRYTAIISLPDSPCVDVMWRPASKRRYRPSVSGKDTSYVGRDVGFMTTQGGKAVALTVTPAHKRWEPDSGLVPASRAISAKVIRSSGAVVLLRAIWRPGSSRT